MRLLIIEDNKALCKEMVETMIEAGYSVDFSHTGLEGEYKAFVNEYDAILLDLNLPDSDGMDILKTLRKEDVSAPVIIISARDELEDRTHGLDIGADVYLVKPFQLVELKARVNALIRRYHGRTQSIITLGKLSINPLDRTVRWADEDMPLTVKEFDILEYIANKSPQLVSAESLAEHVYDEDFDPFSSVLSVHIARLRKN